MEPITAAGTYFDGHSAQPHPVSLRLTDHTLEIAGPALRRDWSLIDLRAGDALPPLTRLSVPAEPGRIEFSDEALAAALAARCPDLRQRPEEGGTLKIVLWSVAAGLSVLLVAIFGVPALAGLLAPLLPAGVESRFGAAVEGQVVSLLDDPPLCKDAAARAVLDRLVARMTAGGGLPPDLKVVVRRHNTANALTLPGARVIVLSDLIAKARNADEFAGVLAHEFGHVAVRDPTRALIQASGTSFLLSLILGDLTGSTIVVALGQAALSAGYSRDAERAADAYAVAMTTRVGGNGAGLAAILERIAKDEADDDAAFLRSHPFTRERAATIRGLAGPDADKRHILDEAEWTVLKGICPADPKGETPPRKKKDGKPGKAM
ncbi:M48 family metallopeptidase [Methylobacterium trifolii]|uniref:Beta-barrel assembly-enhancing protease n=1 Tax=Methylobacterium trifolii TaxID=1003092 RepID=A0ABQ4TUW4_9HYPH|nr:M48 family metallopeptidase [Methylobacterium trifolii]GJE58592.1 Beta-barrel assembly-enhancing protease [Methylobacterium trifolii]